MSSSILRNSSMMEIQLAQDIYLTGENLPCIMQISYTSHGEVYEVRKNIRQEDHSLGCNLVNLESLYQSLAGVTTPS